MEKTVLSNGLTVITDHIEKAVSTLLCYWVKVGGHYEAGYPYGHNVPMRSETSLSRN